MTTADLKKKRQQFRNKFGVIEREKIFIRDDCQCHYCGRKLVSWGMLNEYSQIAQRLAALLHSRGRVTDIWYQQYSPYFKLLDSFWYFDNAAILDHIVPLSHGGQNVVDNLVTACRSCNSSKSNK